MGSKVVIGKVPGYNQIIDEDQKYSNKLLDNLTSIKLSPTGYSINGDIAGDVFTQQKRSEVFKIGPGASSVVGDTLSAMKVWKQLISVQNKMIGASSNTENKFILENVETLEILSTNDSTLTENFQNNFGKNAIEELSDSLSNISIGGVTVNKAKQVTTSLSSQEGLVLLSQSNKTSLTTLLAGKALNVQTALPKQWQTSDYSNQLQLMIKLVSPSGDQASIAEYIIKPLTYLILASSPITSNGVFLGYPPLWKVEADGLMNMKLAGISNLAITRGGIDTQFNIFKQPLNIDVRITLVPIISSYASAFNEGVHSGARAGADTRLMNTVSDMILSFN